MAFVRHAKTLEKRRKKLMIKFMSVEGIHIFFFQHIIAINYSFIIQVQLSCG